MFDDGKSAAKEQLQSTTAFFESRTPDVSVRSALVRAVKRLGGGSYRMKVRIGLLVASVAVLLGLAAVGLVLSSGSSVTASSEPLLTTLAKAATNFWAWGVLFLAASIVYAMRTGNRMARAAARQTRFSYRTIMRLAAEARTTNGTIPIDGTTEHSEHQLKAKLLRAWNADEAKPTEPVEETLVDTDTELQPLAEPEFGGALEASTDDTDTTASESAETDQSEAEGPEKEDVYEALGIDPLKAALAGLDEEDAEFIRDVALIEGATNGFELAEELNEAGAPVPDRPDALEVRSRGLTRDADGNPVADEFEWGDDEERSAIPADEPREPVAEPVADDGASEDEQERAGLLTRVKRTIQTVRMDVTTTLNFGELGYRFVLPTAITTLLIVMVNQTLWFQPWVYFAILAASVTVGGSYYTFYKWNQHRRLENLRRDRNPTSWNSVRVLAKTVETEEATVYMAWMNGKRYADHDRARIANKLANRWYQYLQTNECWPAMQEKFHRDLRTYDPALYATMHGDMEEGIPAIYDDIMRVINESNDPEGIVPKHQLAERVMGKDFGVGHDPDLIADCYEELYPQSIAETDIELEDTDGNVQTVTVVHRRDRRIEPELAKLRARFSSSVSADDEAGYELPDVEQPSTSWVTDTVPVSD